MKRSFLLSLLVLCLMLLVAVPALAVTPTLSVTTQNGAVGDTISVQVAVADNTGFEGCILGLCYDDAYLQGVSYQAGSAFSGLSAGNVKNFSKTANSAMASFTLASAESNTADGVLVTFTFKIVGRPASGSTSVKLAKYSGDSYLVQNYQDVPVTVEDAAPIVISGGSYVAVTGISLDKSTMQINIGGSSALKATISPAAATNSNLRWSSSDAAVAAVSANGVVSGLRGGVSTITVTAADGGFAASCQVTVGIPQNDTPVTGVTLNQSALALDMGKTAKLIATVQPAHAANTSVSWKSSNEAVATVVNGLITAKAAGSATITVTTEDGGKTAMATVTVSQPVVHVTAIDLDQTALALNPGQSATLTATVYPGNAAEQTYSWSSSNEAVAQVSNGKVVAKAAGQAVITVKTTDGAKTATCTVTVTDKPIAVSGVALSIPRLNLVVGSSKTISAAVEPANAAVQTITWSSSDQQVAAVAAGKITAVAKGSAVITATAQDGGFTAACEVTVTEAEIAVTGIKLDQTSLNLVAGQKQTLIETITPRDATNLDVTWKSSDTDVVQVKNGRVTGISAGTATITVTTDDGKYTATCRVTVADSQSAGSLSNFSLSGQPFPFSDIPAVSGNWVYEGVYKAYQLGLMKGNSTTAPTFGPTGSYKVSEALMTVARLHNIYMGGDGQIETPAVWYQAAVDYCIANGIIKAGDFADYNRNITRAEMAYVYANALPDTDLVQINSVTALPDVQLTDLYGASIFKLYRAGVLSGNDAKGTYYPNNNITRREAAVIISRMALPAQRVSLALSAN